MIREDWTVRFMTHIVTWARPERHWPQGQTCVGAGSSSGTARGRQALPNLTIGALRRELDGDHVAVGDHVVAALEPQRSAVARARVAAGVAQRLPADHLGADEAALDVGVDQAGRVPDRQAAAQMPGLRRLVLAGGEERDQVEQLERAADDGLQARTRPARGPRASPRRPRRSARRARTPAARRRRPPGRRRSLRARRSRPAPRLSPRRRWPRTGPAWRSAATDRASRAGASCGGGTVRAGLPGLQRLDHPRQPLRLGDRVRGRPTWPAWRRGRSGARPARGRRRSARSRSSRCLRAGRPGPRDGRRPRRCGHGRRGRSRRSHGCWPGTGCRDPRPCARRRPVRRCRETRSCRARSSTRARSSGHVRPGARRAPARSRRSARSS